MGIYNIMISKREYKYRCKIIAENHLKKDGQRYLDQYVISKSLTYKKVYLNYEWLLNMLVKYNFSKLGNAIKDVGTSCEKTANAFQNLAANLATIT